MKFFQATTCDVASKNPLPVMLLRGVAGIALMSWSFTLMVTKPMIGWTMLAVSILLLKGCPTCWGMHLVNAMRARSTARTEADIQHVVDIGAEYQRVMQANRRAYHPVDMAAHLFPPEDVERFRREAASQPVDAQQQVRL